MIAKNSVLGKVTHTVLAMKKFRKCKYGKFNFIPIYICLFGKSAFPYKDKQKMDNPESWPVLGTSPCKPHSKEQ